MISWGYRMWGAGMSWAAATSSAGVGKWYLEGDGGGRFIFGNYEGYISEDLFGDLRREFGASIDYFDHDYSVREKFGRGIYDVAVVSTSVLLDMAERNLLGKVDWGRFDVKGGENDPKELFSEAVRAILDSGENFLEYGVPYFLNKLSFCYVGDEIEGLGGRVSWEDLVGKISKEGRFKSEGNRPRLAMIDDPRTVLSLARLVSGSNDVNLSEGDDAFEIYGTLSSRGLNPKNMGRNFLLMSPSSSLMIDSLASRTVKGGFMYNGDCLFASKGGNAGTPPDKFNIVETDRDIYFLDFLVFSGKLTERRAERVYGFARRLLFEGMDGDNILERGEDGKFKHPPLRNFDYVQYTPSLKTMLSQVEEKYFEGDGDAAEIRKKILRIEKNSPSNDLRGLYERPFLGNKQKSDVFRDFERFKLTL